MKPKRQSKLPVLLSIGIILGICTISHAERSKNRDFTLNTKPFKTKNANTKNKHSIAPPAFIHRKSNTPDINQHMVRKDLFSLIPTSQYKHFLDLGGAEKVFNSKDYCGPCTIANNLMWLDKNGFPNISKYSNPIVGGVKIARKLGLENYTNAENGGTSYPSFVNGTVKFLRERNIPIKRIRIVSTIDRRNKSYDVDGIDFKYEVRIPTPDDFKQALHKRSIVGKIYGHYRPLRGSKKNSEGEKIEIDLSGKARNWSTNTLYRTGGHWVAPVGYGLDKSGKISPDTLIIRNSAGGGQSKQRWSYQNWKKVNSTSCKYSKASLRTESKLEKRGVLNGHYALSPFPKGTYSADGKKGSKTKLEVLEGLVFIEL